MAPPQQVEAARRASPASATINAYDMERNNSAARRHSRRIGRVANAVSKAPGDLEQRSTLAFAHHLLVIPRRGLRHRLPPALPTQGPNGSRKK